VRGRGAAFAEKPRAGARRAARGCLPRRRLRQKFHRLLSAHQGGRDRPLPVRGHGMGAAGIFRAILGAVCPGLKMSREAAKKIVALMIKHGAEQNAVLAEIQSICADDEFQKYKRMIGQSMGCMLLDVINPIVELYPDLKPSQLE